MLLPAEWATSGFRRPSRVVFEDRAKPTGHRQLRKEIAGIQSEGGSTLKTRITFGVTRMAWCCGPDGVKVVGQAGGPRNREVGIYGSLQPAI
ncbi:hypothetical protein PVAP13_8NG065400 [Panicum virgatum]|uniref:Uncharacterized protein n=1 Tax=Panicum virgatum TaxID=38727 RepID=A0A8T0P4X8_PANVG|nr:hypothetical protein PVAP13_8NG065400 [Panicum virgatum]